MLLAHTPLFEPALRFLSATVCSSAQFSASCSFPGSFTASLYFSFSGARFCPSFLVSLFFFVLFWVFFIFISFLLSFSPSFSELKPIAMVTGLLQLLVVIPCLLYPGA
ncbi:hypothetical protein AMELA_G00061440, partial [Ameiurus melas]